jgi:hypothetical protein
MPKIPATDGGPEGWTAAGLLLFVAHFAAAILERAEGNPQEAVRRSIALLRGKCERQCDECARSKGLITEPLDISRRTYARLAVSGLCGGGFRITVADDAIAPGSFSGIEARVRALHPMAIVQVIAASTRSRWIQKLGSRD